MSDGPEDEFEMRQALSREATLKALIIAKRVLRELREREARLQQEVADE